MTLKPKIIRNNIDSFRPWAVLVPVLLFNNTLDIGALFRYNLIPVGDYLVCRHRNHENALQCLKWMYRDGLLTYNRRR